MGQIQSWTGAQCTSPLSLERRNLRLFRAEIIMNHSQVRLDHQQTALTTLFRLYLDESIDLRNLSNKVLLLKFLKTLDYDLEFFQAKSVQQSYKLIVGKSGLNLSQVKWVSPCDQPSSILLSQVLLYRILKSQQRSKLVECIMRMQRSEKLYLRDLIGQIQSLNQPESPMRRSQRLIDQITALQQEKQQFRFTIRQLQRRVTECQELLQLKSQECNQLSHLIQGARQEARCMAQQIDLLSEKLEDSQSLVQSIFNEKLTLQFQLNSSKSLQQDESLSSKKEGRISLSQKVKEHMLKQALQIKSLRKLLKVKTAQRPVHL